MNEYEEIKDRLLKLEDGGTYLLRMSQKKASAFAESWNKIEGRPKVTILLIDEDSQIWKQKV